MARIKQEKTKYTKEGEFRGVTVPEFKNIEVKVISTIYSVKKGDEVLIHDENFNINISVKNIIKSEIVNLNEKLNEATGRNLYVNRNEFFSYYTYDISKEEGLMKFNKILNVLTDFDKNYNISNLINVDEQNELIQMFNKNGAVKDDLLMINYSQDREQFYIVALDRVEMDEYRRLAKNANQTDKIKFTFLEDIYPKMKNKTCFIFHKNDYDFIQKEVNNLLVNKKTKISENKDKIQTDKEKYEALNYDKSNWAGFNIEFSEEEQGFYFYLKGYKQKNNYRYAESFSSLEDIVREIVVIQERVDTINMEDEVGKYPYKIRLNQPFLSNIYDEVIPEVKILKEKSKRLKWFVPIESYPELKLISDAYLKNEEIFTKKFVKQELDVGTRNYVPVVSDLGNCYLYFGKDVGCPTGYIELSLPEFKNIKSLLEEKESFERQSRIWEEGLYLSTKSLLEVGTAKEIVVTEAYRRAELKYKLDGVDGNKKVSQRKKI